MEPESRVLDIVDQLYGAALGEGDWACALSALEEFCGADNTARVRVDHAIQLSFLLASLPHPDVVAADNQQWWAEYPTIKVTRTAPVDQLTGQSERRLSLFTPHLIRAVAIQARLQRLALENIVLTGLRSAGRAGLIVVDATLRILLANALAETLLTDGAGVHCRGGHFGLADPHAQGLLHRTILACIGSFQDLATTRTVPWLRGDNTQPLSIEVVPWSSIITPANVAGTQPAAILVIHNPQVEADASEPRKNLKAAPIRSPDTKTRAELFAVITQDIAANLDECDMSLSWLAKRHGLTARRVRDLFYAENTSFTEYLLNARLDRARAMLSDPALADVNVATIALDSGFGDISWFHHVFRRRFAMTPADMRRQAKYRQQ